MATLKSTYAFLLLHREVHFKFYRL